MSRKHHIASLAFASALLAASPGEAQEEAAPATATPATATPATATPATATPATATPATATPATAAPEQAAEPAATATAPTEATAAPSPEASAASSSEAAADEPEEDRYAGGRFRFGFEIGGGPVIGDEVGGALGIVLQLGAQIGRLWHLYYQPTLYVAGFGETGSDPSGSAFVATGQGGMLGLTIKQFLEIGVGGGALIGWVGACDVDSEACTGGSETIPMFNARLAFVIGFKLPNSRLGIPIAAQYQSLFDESLHVSTLIFTIGIQRY